MGGKLHEHSLEEPAASFYLEPAHHFSLLSPKTTAPPKYLLCISLTCAHRHQSPTGDSCLLEYRWPRTIDNQFNGRITQYQTLKLSDPLHSRERIPLCFAYQMNFMASQHSQMSPKGLNFLLSPKCGSIVSFPQLPWAELLRDNGTYALTVLWSVYLETWLVWLWYGRTSGLGSTHYHSYQKVWHHLANKWCFTQKKNRKVHLPVSLYLYAYICTHTSHRISNIKCG